MRPCFAFKAATAEAATLSIYDEIGFWGVQAKDFTTQLREVKAKTINVEINSPGGDVFAGLAIYNALRASGKEIVVKVMGVAASAASLIAMAGDKIVMPKNSFLMVHNPWSFAMGNAEELRKSADTLDKIGASLLQTYASRTGLPEDEIAAMLSTDTWLSADEALEKGFATEVVDEIKANASFDMARADLPENVKAVFLAAATVEPDPVDDDANKQPPAKPDPEPEPQATHTEQIVAVAQAAGMEAYASTFALANLTLDEVRARIADAREIKALAVVAGGTPEQADAAIRAGTSVADFRAALVAALAEEDEKTHTNGVKPTVANQQTTGSTEKPPVSSQGLWASHNKHAK